MTRLLICRDCKEFLYSDDTPMHCCALGFDEVDSDQDEDIDGFLEEIHLDPSFDNTSYFFPCL